MRSLYFLLPTLLAIIVSFLVVRASAIALMMTGLDLKKAKFQALSAFSGTGFTTKEAESVVNHPVRRKIITWLMIFGNVGIVTVIITSTSSLVTTRGLYLPVNMILFVAFTLGLYMLATRKGYVRSWENYIEKKLIRSKAFEEGFTEDLLHLIEGYGLIKAIITDNSPLINKSLAGSNLAEKGILVLGIEREKAWVPTPKETETIRNNDRLVVYGSLVQLRELLNEQPTA